MQAFFRKFAYSSFVVGPHDEVVDCVETSVRSLNWWLRNSWIYMYS